MRVKIIKSWTFAKELNQIKKFAQRCEKLKLDQPHKSKFCPQKSGGSMGGWIDGWIGRWVGGC